ncbi:MAG: hypothetical protein N2544_02270 [Burkholderiales bacterium]|nr:hypothetical protein [Burkholderiales bacterium]
MTFAGPIAVRRRLPASSTRQGGMALLALLALIVTGAVFLMVQKLNAASAQVDRAAVTNRALLQAKQALLAYAALDGGQSQAMNRPGSLPCPAQPLASNPVQNWGTALGSCGTAATRVGRLPWKTLGLPELRDGSGELLWYAISPRFRDTATSVINSDTRGQIRIVGPARSEEVVAVIFAPGAPVRKSDNSPQDRSTAAERDKIVNYLEGYTLDPNALLANITDQFTSGAATDHFNDQLVTITQEELMAATENVVAARLRTLILPRLQQYLADWGALPYAAPFVPTDPSVDAHATPPLLQGRLPLALGAGTLDLRWRALSYDIKNGALTVGTCSTADPRANLTCSIPAPGPGPVNVSVNVEVEDVGFGLVEPMPPVTSASPSMSVVVSQSLTGAVQADGSAVIQANFTINSTNPVSFSLALPQKTALSGFKYDWLVLNQWYQQILYAIPPTMAPGAAGSCSTSSPGSCLTVERRAGPAVSAAAALILAGRPVLRESPPSAECSIQKRPAWDPNPTACPEALGPANYLQNYFEAQNNDGVTTLPVTLKEGYRSPGFNDRVVWLSPGPGMECKPWPCD